MRCNAHSVIGVTQLPSIWNKSAFAADAGSWRTLATKSLFYFLSPYRRPLAAPARFESLIFAIGALLFIVIHCGIFIHYLSGRFEPVPVDDGYVHILKASQIEQCFFQDCPALQSLSEQVEAPSSDDQLAWLRYREQVRAFSSIFLLHSLLLDVVHDAGLSWPDAYNLLGVTSSLFVALSVAAILWAVVGPGPAGLALLFLSFVVFPGKEFYLAKPTTWALGTALFTWAAVIWWRERSWLWLILGSGIMVLLHPIGRIYAFVTLILLLLLAEQRWSWRAVCGMGAIFIVASAAFILPEFVDRPMLRFGTGPSDGVPGWQGVGLNALELAANFGLLIVTTGGLTVLLMPIAVATVPHDRQRILVLLVAVLTGLLVVSLLYYVPRYPGLLGRRLLVPWFLLLSGGFGVFLWQMLQGKLDQAHAARTGLLSKLAAVANMSPERLLSLMVAWTLGITVLVGSVRNVLQAEQIAHREDYQFAIEQVRQLASVDGAAESAVVYTAEEPMHFYLANGMYDRQAVFLPVVVGTPEAEAWLDGSIPIGWGVAWNPIDAMRFGWKGGVPLRHNTELKIERDNAALPSEIWLRLDGRSGNPSLSVEGSVAGIWQELAKISASDDPSHWQRIQLPERIAQLRLKLEEPMGLFHRQEVLLRGLRVSEDATLNWPWDEDITLDFDEFGSTKKTNLKARFASTNLFPLPCRGLKVIDDSGSTVLAQVTCLTEDDVGAGETKMGGKP